MPTFKIPTIAILTAFSAAALGSFSPAFAVEVADPVPSAGITAGASSAYYGPESAAHLIDNSGMDKAYGHDNHPSAGTMWHSAVNPKPSSPAAGLPESPAWVRFDFKEAQTVGSCEIWNHNQLNLTNRGFRHARAFMSLDGTTFEKVLVNGQEVFEIPQAKGNPSEPSSCVLRLPGKAVKSVILAAVDNWGGNVYGLSEVQFFGPGKDVPIDSLPVPTQITAAQFPFLFDDAKNAWSRQVGVETDTPLREPVDVTVACGGAARTTHFEVGPRGLRTFTAALPEGKGLLRSATDALSITVKTAHFEKTAETAIVAPEKWRHMEEVIVAYKTHLDIGYTHTRDELLATYKTSMMDRAMGIIDSFDSLPADNQFKWMLPAWAVDLVYNHQDDPARKARIEKRIKDGHLVWHAYPYTFETDGADAEEIVRSLHYGTNLSRQFNRPLLRTAKLTDAPGHGWMTPTLLKNAGISLLQIGANSGTPGVPVPMLFWWEGPDGSRLLTMFSTQFSYGYGTSETPPADWNHSSWLAMIVTADNSGPPSRADVEAVQRRIRSAIPGVRVRFGDMDDFASRLVKEDLSDLKVVRGDMPDTWIHGIMTLPDATALHRHSAGALASLGELAAAANAWGLPNRPGLPGLMREAYDQSAFYAEHTWGMYSPQAAGAPANQYGENWRKFFAAGAYKKFDAEFQVHGDYARHAMAKAGEGITAHMNALAKGVKHAGPRVAVFNPLPQAQSTQASVALPADLGTPTAVVDLENGKSVPFAVEGGMLRLMAAQLPAGGYRSFGIRIGRSAAQTTPAEAFADNTLETPRFKAVFDLEKGGIVSLVDKTDGRELVDASRHALGQFVHERFSLDNVVNYSYAYIGRYAPVYGKNGMPNSGQLPYLARTPAKWTAKAERTPLEYRVTLSAGETFGLAEGYTETFAFPDDAACVDIAWSVKNKTPDPIPEGGWLCFPFKVAHPAFRVGRAGGSIDPAKDIISGHNRDLMSVDTGISIREGATGAGGAVASADLPLWSMGEPGLWKFTREAAVPKPNLPVPTKPELFANLYNNQWDTNFRPWQDGSWTVAARVWPVADKATEEQALFTPAWPLRQPVLAAYADGPAGILPVTAGGLALSRPGIRVMAFSPNPDETAPGTLLRLWEQSGTGGSLTVTLPKGFKATKAQPINLRGEKTGEAVEIKDGQFTADLGAWAPKTWVLE